MSEREKAIQLLDKIPDSKMYYILGVLEGSAIPDEIEPDKCDLEMIAQAKNENNGFTVSFDEILAKEGLTYADIQD